MDTEAVMTRTENPLRAILRQPVTIETTVPWAEDGLTMTFELSRPGNWGEISAIQQTQALAEIDGEEAKAEAIVGIVYKLILDAHGVPGFDPRREGESLESFRARFAVYFDEAEAGVMLLGVFSEFASKDVVALSERKAAFRG